MDVRSRASGQSEGDSSDATLIGELLNSGKKVAGVFIDEITSLPGRLINAGDELGEGVYDATHAEEGLVEYLTSNSKLGDLIYDISQVPPGERAEWAAKQLVTSAAERYDLSTEGGWLRLTGDVESVLAIGVGVGAAGEAGVGASAIDAERAVEFSSADIAGSIRAGVLDAQRELQRTATAAHAGVVETVAGADASVSKIQITEEGLNHVVERHAIEGAENAGKSIFSAEENLTDLVRKADSVTPTQQAGGNVQRIVDAGRTIGVDRATGQATSFYTVITDAAGRLVTMFPGKP